jgi:hypothetical protein
MHVSRHERQRSAHSTSIITDERKYMEEYFWWTAFHDYGLMACISSHPADKRLPQTVYPHILFPLWLCGWRVLRQGVVMSVHEGPEGVYLRGHHLPSYVARTCVRTGVTRINFCKHMMYLPADRLDLLVDVTYRCNSKL